MADGAGGGIKGIGIAVTADASQVKRVFNEAIQGFQSKTIDITLEAVEGKSFERIFAALRNQNVEIGVTLQPNRQTMRDFRKDFNERLAKEGGVSTPIRAKGITQAEGKVIREAISRSIGSPIVKVMLEWEWKNGPPPTEFGGTVRPSGGGGGGPTEAWGPMRPPPTSPASTQDVNAFIRQEVARRMAAQGTSGSRATGAAVSSRVQETPDEPPAVAADKAERRKRRERKPHRYDQRAGESQEEWTARLLEEHGRATEKLSSTSAQVARRASNRLVQLEKRLGIESGRETQPVPGKTQTRVGGRTVITPVEQPQPVRTAEGRLLSEVLKESRAALRASGELTGPTPGTVAAERLKAQKQMGIKIGPTGVEDLGQLASMAPSAAAQNALMERINERIFGIDQPQRDTGFRGGGRVARSMFSEEGKGLSRGIEEVAPRGPSETISSGKIAAERFLGAFAEEVESGMRLDFRKDPEEMAAFRQRWSTGEAGWGPGFAKAQEFAARGDLHTAVFGERTYNPETGTFDLNSEDAFEGALYARAQLDAQARNKKLPGVGPAAVRYAQAETRDDIPSGKMTQQGLDYIAQRDALSSVISQFFEGRRISEEEAATSAAGKQAAETTAQALTPPKRPIVAQRRPDESIEDYRARKAETLEPYFASLEKFEKRRARLMPGLNDPKLMTYPLMSEPPRQGMATDRIEGVRRPGDPEGQTRTMYSGVGSFVPFRPQAQAQAEPDLGDTTFPMRQGGEPDLGDTTFPMRGSLPDLSDLGFTPEQVMAALSEPAMAASGVTPPPVPPGTVSGGGEWGGGEIPVRVMNFNELKGIIAASGGAETVASEPVAAGPVAMPTDDVGKTAPKSRKKKAVTAQEAVAEAEEPEAAAKKGAAPKASPALGASVRTFRYLDAALDKAERDVTNAEAALEKARVTPEANIEPALKRATGANERLAAMLSGRGAPEAAVRPQEAAKALGDELEKILVGRTPGPTPDRPDVLPPGNLSAQINKAQRAGTLTLEQGQALQGRRLDRVSPIQGAIREVEEQLAMSRQGLPIRSAPVSVAQLVAGPTRGQTTARLSRAGDALREAESLDRVIFDIGDKLKLREEEQKNINAALADGVELTEDQLKRQAAIPGEVKNLEAELKKAKSTQQGFLQDADKLSKLTTGEKLANLGKSFSGGIAGTLIYGTALGAVTGGLAALAAATAPVIERTMGYKQATAATTSELSKQIAQTGGLAEALTAQRLASANMTKESASRIQSIISERTELMAANQQITEQTKLFAAAAEIRSQNAGGLGVRDKAGQRTRFGSDINLYESTGGIANTSLLAPGFSTQEALGHLFEQAERSRAAEADRVRRESPAAAKEGAQGGPLLDFGGGGAKNIFVPGLDLPGELEEFRGSLQAANEELDLHVAQTEADRKKVAEFADALDRADMQGFASAVKQSGFYVSGLENLDPEAQARVVTQAAENYARGVARRDPAQVIEGMGDQVRAAVEGSFENARIERQLVIPAQRGLSNAASPVLSLSEQEFFGAAAPGGGAFGDVLGAAVGRQGIRPGAQAAFRRASQATLRAQARQAEGRQREEAALDELFEPLGAGVKQEYMEVRSDIQSIGLELAQLQQEQVNIQIRLSTEQFDEQIRQVKRALADARERATGIDASGNEGAGADLGMLERQGLMLSRASAAVGFQQQQLGLQSQALQLQNQLLSRRSQELSFQSTELSFQSKQLGFQSTALSLAQNQRQINFQQAVAGFVSPGLTPEERAARVREAEIEAEIAQKQQDIAVAQFGIEQEQFGIEQGQYAIAQQQFALDGAQLAIQQQAYVLAQQQYGLSVAQYQNQQAIIDAQNERAVEDLEIQERLIEAAEEAQQILAANEKTIEALRRELEKEMQMAGSYLQQASGVATTIAQVSTSLLAQFGGDLQTILTAYSQAWISFRSRVTGTPNVGENPELKYTDQSRSAPTYNAPGAVGLATSPTHMVVGDAGGEMVAILRNPRPVAAGMVGGGGGGMQIYMPVTISGNTIAAHDEREIEEWATRLTRVVEQRLGMRANMYGFGGAGR